MPNPLAKAANDLGVVDQAPANQTDARVPMAEQSALNTEISIGLFRRANTTLGWVQPPVLSVTAPRQINLNGVASLPGSPTALIIATSVVVPVLTSTASVVRQEQILSLVGVTAQVGAEHDPSLNVTFQYRNPQNTTQILPITKENAKRYRYLWLLVLSPDVLTKTALLNALTLQDGDRRLAISDVSSAGFSSGALQLYTVDPNWVANRTYTIHPDYIDITPVCKVRRLQNYLDRGYTWGANGEESLSAAYNLPLLAVPTGNALSLQAIAQQRLQSLFAGKPGLGSGLARTVQNLTSGSVAGNPGVPGEAAGALDGSVCLANDQRTSFTNQGTIQRHATQVVIAGNDGTGRAVVAVSLNSNAPAGTRFSDSAADHKIYASNGLEQSGFGSFTSLGSNAALTWIAASGSAAITPGSTVYVVPGVISPPGAGFSVPFTAVEKVWRNTAQIAPANVLLGGNDLSAYADPANGEEYIVVLGRERMALHYIYKKVVVASDSNGVIAIPSNERGSFAFVQGVSNTLEPQKGNRLDRPVWVGLTPSTNYNALIYYPPRSIESWQFQFSYPEYQGTGLTEPTWLDGARIVSTPLLAIHTQGGGGSVFQGAEPLRFSPISQYLPAVNSGIPAHRLFAACQLVGEASPGAGATFRDLPTSLLLPAAGLALPAIGQVLSLVAATINQPRSLKAGLLADGQPMGFRPPTLLNAVEYQAVVAFVAEKAGDRRLVVLTRNTTGAENIAFNSDSGVAIDTFLI